MKYGSPPAWVCWLLESIVPASYREAMLGDLIEEYNLRASLLAGHRLSLHLESRLSISCGHSLVFVARRKLAHQYEHRCRRLPRHRDAETCAARRRRPFTGELAPSPILHPVERDLVPAATVVN